MPRFLFIASLLLSLAATAPAVDLATIDGRRYQEAEITWFYADAVIVRYEGVKYARLPLIRLRPESLVALGFPPPAEEEPAEGMEEGMEGMDDLPTPAAPVQRAPRLRPIGAASGSTAPRSSNNQNRGERENPPAVEVETEDAPKPRMTPRSERAEGMTRPKKKKPKKMEQAPLPPEDPFADIVEELFEDNETQRLQDRKLDVEPDKLEIRPFPGDNL
jgi:hypothetical protein